MLEGFTGRRWRAVTPLPSPTAGILQGPPGLPTAGAFPGSLLPQATAPAACSCGQPSAGLEFLMLHFSLLSVCQNFLDCRAKSAEPD